MLDICAELCYFGLKDKFNLLIWFWNGPSDTETDKNGKLNFIIFSDFLERSKNAMPGGDCVMANIYDVAKKAGVSKSTVSLVLNNSPLVKPDTRELVMAAIQELGYVPNSNARCLRNQKMNSLGIVILTEEQRGTGYDIDQFVGLCSYNIADGISLGLAGAEYSVATEYFSVKDAEFTLPKIVQDRRVDGVFVVGSFFDVNLISRIQKNGIPTVAVGIGYPNDETAAVIADPTEGSYIGAKHLVETGHRSICFLNCPKIFRSAVDRARGVELALEESREKIQDQWILYTEKNNGFSGYETIRSFWESGARPDAIFAANAPLALGALRYLREVNVRVPEDVSLLVYEDSVLCGYHVPSLSAINIQKEKMGRRAASLMLSLLGKSSEEQGCETETLTPYIVERDSVRVRSIEK